MFASPCRKFLRAALLFTVVLCAAPALRAQVFLTADGETDSYTLVNNALGAGPETPDCSHPDFGEHITQASDSDLGKPAFVFNIHVTPDNDRYVNFDRQRLEIKTDGSSPAYVKGFPPRAQGRLRPQTHEEPKHQRVQRDRQQCPGQDQILTLFGQEPQTHAKPGQDERELADLGQGGADQERRAEAAPQHRHDRKRHQGFADHDNRQNCQNAHRAHGNVAARQGKHEAYRDRRQKSYFVVHGESCHAHASPAGRGALPGSFPTSTVRECLRWSQAK
jgi:hypothetical protein